jgi:mevalonate kinase
MQCSTKNLVAAVKALRDHLPGVVDPIIQSIEEISLAFLRLLERQRCVQYAELPILLIRWY